jgi:hypothetical protein
MSEMSLEERVAALETDALAQSFLLHRTLAALASLAPDPAAAVALIRGEVDAHFAELNATARDPAEHQDFEQTVANVLDNAFGPGGARFMPLPRDDR